MIRGNSMVLIMELCFKDFVWLTKEFAFKVVATKTMEEPGDSSLITKSLQTMYYT